MSEQYRECLAYLHQRPGAPIRFFDNRISFPIWQGTFLPYGQEWNPQLTTNHYKFTGKERDAESGLDFFGARFYSSTMGRWMSPDWAEKPEPVPYADLSDPQSLNLYSYVRNNPMSQTDEDGHTCATNSSDGHTYDNGDGKGCSTVDEEEKNRQPAAIVHGQTDDPCDALCQGVLHSPQSQRTWDLSSRVTTNYVAVPLLTFLSVAVPGALEAGGPEITTLGIGGPYYLYEKVGPNGEHLKYGVTKNPGSRYGKSKMGGGRLKIVASGSKSDMLKLERDLHESMPIGPEEGQSFYIDKQVGKGYDPPPYQ